MANHSMLQRPPRSFTGIVEKLEKKNQRMAQLVRARVDSFDEQTLARRQPAIIRWALRQPHILLGSRFAIAFLLASTYRKMYKVASLDCEDLRRERLDLIRKVEYYKSRVIDAAVDRSRGGREKARKDPKFQAMRKAKRFFNEWADGKHRSIRTNDQFAMECVRRFPELTSVSYIAKNRVPAWRKERREEK